MTIVSIRPLRLLLVLLALAAPALAQGALAQPAFLRNTPSGNYLAGEQAMLDLSTEHAARYFANAARAEPDNALFVERAFVALAMDGQIGRAAAMAKHLLTFDSGNELADLVIAAEALKERRYREANLALAGLGRDNFTAITGSVLRAWALIGDNRIDEAGRALDEVARGALADFLIFHRALMAEAAGDAETGLVYAREAYEAEPYVARIAEVYARMLANAGRFKEARRVLEDYRAEGLSHPLVLALEEPVEAGQRPGVFTANVQIGAAEMFHGIGVALARDGNRDLAVVFLRLGLYLDPSADVIAIALGQIFDAAGRYREASAIYDTVPANSPMKPAAAVRVAYNLEALENRSEALGRLETIIAGRPDDFEALSLFADLLRYDHQYARAAEIYTRAIAVSGGNRPADWWLYYARGVAYERAGLWERGEADFLEALALNPNQPQVLNYLGYVWADTGVNLERALELIEAAVSVRPREGYIVDSLGWAYYRLGRYVEAVQVLERAARLSPDNPEINDHLGDAYWRTGRFDEARFQWAIAIYLDEEGTVSEAAARKIEEGLLADAPFSPPDASETPTDLRP